MKKRMFLLLILTTLSLVACQQTSKKAPDFSVTERLSKIDLREEKEELSSSSSKKKSSSSPSNSKKKSTSSSKSSAKKSKEKEQTAKSEIKTVTESDPSLSKKEISKDIFGVDWDRLTEEEKQFLNWFLASALSEEFENEGRFQSWYDQGFTMEEVLRQAKAKGYPQEFLPSLEKIGERYNNYLDNRASEAEVAGSDRRQTENEYYQWERDDLDDALLEEPQGSIPEDSIDDFDWSFQNHYEQEPKDWAEYGPGLGWANSSYNLDDNLGGGEEYD